jgi:uncharacterized OsmC-like protein
VLVIRRIHVRYHLKVESSKRETAERVLGVHADACPVARTLGGCIAITTELAAEELQSP